jgi:diaminohydroxyphosphoribosylaminopyrimidine deaminase/5-amino-6-(5-phosphoribosylamino)uracil reductase
VLREAGVAVEEGPCAAEAREINAGFLQRVKTGRPLVTLKLAASLDGRVATASGESRWITGPAARERAHALRASHDAILVGTGTVAADDPELTCRLPGLGARSPLRVVLDRHLRLLPAAKVFAPPCWVLTLADDAPELCARGVEVVTVPDDLAAMLGILGGRGLTRILVEGGGRLAASLLKAGLVDRLVWMHAPMTIGGDGIPAIAGLGLQELAAARRFELMSSETAGGDVIESFRRMG